MVCVGSRREAVNKRGGAKVNVESQPLTLHATTVARSTSVPLPFAHWRMRFSTVSAYYLLHLYTLHLGVHHTGIARRCRCDYGVTRGARRACRPTGSEISSARRYECTV